MVLVGGSIVSLLGLVLSGYGAFLLLRGSPEGYHNENLRHLAGGLTQMVLGVSLVSGQLNRINVALISLVFCCGAIAWSWSLLVVGR